MTSLTRQGSELTFDVTVAEANVLGNLAAETLRAQTAAFAVDVFEEASRFEAAQRGNASTTAEFTSAHIVDGAAAARRKAAFQARSKGKRAWVITGRLSLYVAAAGVGVGGNMMFEKTWAMVVFVASLVAGLFIVGLLEIGERGSE